MARRARRRRNYTWFPNLGTAPDETEEPSIRLSGLRFGVEVPGKLTIPLTMDKPIDEAAAALQEGFTLADLQTSSYAVRRIVGNIQASHGYSLPAQGQAPQLAVLFGAALAVVPWDEFSDTPEADVNPLLAVDINEPWMWRKTILFGLNGSPQPTGPILTPAAAALAAFPTISAWAPQSRFEYVDQKTMRTVKRDERLCLIVAASFIQLADQPLPEGEAHAVAGWFDYRILAQLRRTTNRGRGSVR